MQSLFKTKIIYFSLTLFYVLLLYKITSMGKQLDLLALGAGCCILFLGIKYPLFGLLFSFATMNSFFNLIPRQLPSDSLINKSWDFGFLLMIVFGLSLFIKNIKKLKKIIMPFYFKAFVTYFIICIISLLITFIKYPFPMIDSFRTFRYCLGYLFIIPFLLLYCMYEKDTEKTINFNRFLNYLYLISFALIALYNLQFFMQKAIFTGYIGIQATYLRSIPNFLFICYFFSWYNFAAWLTNNRMYPGGKLYIILCLTGTLFTFTRGIYISVAFSIMLLMFIIFKSTKYNATKVIITCIAVCILFSTTYTLGFLKPFILRLSTITTSITSNQQKSTFWFRLNLLKDRIRLFNKDGLLLGIGFVHNKYGYKFGNYGDPEKTTELCSLWCGDIAWIQIIGRTGWIGFCIFTLYVISIIYYFLVDVKRRIRFNKPNRIILFEIAALIELIRLILQTMNGNIYVSNTQNPALILSISIYCFNQIISTERSQ